MSCIMCPQLPLTKPSSKGFALRSKENTSLYGNKGVNEETEKSQRRVEWFLVFCTGKKVVGFTA
jgi:hypothetical protein